MTTYKFPESLGGGEHEAAEHSVHLAGFNLEGVSGRLWLQVKDLTEVKPPPPEEPPLFTPVLVDWPDFPPAKAIFRRYHDGWCEPGSDPDHPLHKYRTWAELNKHGTPVLLVPDPFAEPVELPWYRETHGDTTIFVNNDTRPPSGVWLGWRGVIEQSLPVDTAREMARALWAAADRAETSDG